MYVLHILHTFDAYVVSLKNCVQSPRSRGPVVEPIAPQWGLEFVACLTGLPVDFATPEMDDQSWIGK